jgi:hypothetical protein
MEAEATGGGGGDGGVVAVGLDGVDSGLPGCIQQRRRVEINGDQHRGDLRQCRQTADGVQFTVAGRLLPPHETDGVGPCLVGDGDVVFCAQAAHLHEQPLGAPGRHADAPCSSRRKDPQALPPGAKRVGKVPAAGAGRGGR